MTTENFDNTGLWKIAEEIKKIKLENTGEFKEKMKMEKLSFLQIVTKDGIGLTEITQFRGISFNLQKSWNVAEKAMIKYEDSINSFSNIENLFDQYPKADYILCYDFSFNQEQASLLVYRVEKGKNGMPVVLLNQDTSGNSKKPVNTAFEQIAKEIQKREELIYLFFERELSEPEQNDLAGFFISVSFILNMTFINTLALNGGKTEFFNFNPDIISELKNFIPEIDNQEEKKTKKPPKEYVQEFPVIPKLYIDNHSALMDTLIKFKENDFKPDKATGLDKATKDYKAEYYNGTGKGKRKKYADNSIDLLKDSKKELYLTEEDFNQLEEYINTNLDEIPKELFKERGNYIYTREENEVMNGISSGYSFIESKLPNINYSNPPEIYMTYEDIAKGMGNTLTPRVLAQILQALKTFDNIRITNNWSNEFEARGLEYQKLFNSYGVSIQGDLLVSAGANKTSVKLLNFDYVENIRKENTPEKIWDKKEQKFIECKGKPGIVIYQYPPLLAYHKATKQLDYIPVEWLNIPGTGTSPELKRIKRHICHRIRKLEYFKDVDNNKNSKDKRNFDPNRKNKNFNKIKLDTLLTKYGGYNFEPIKEGDYIPKKGGRKVLTDSNGETIFVPATAEDVKKKNKSIQVLKRKEKNKIIKYLFKLKEICPRLQKIIIDDKDDSFRLIVE